MAYVTTLMPEKWLVGAERELVTSTQVQSADTGAEYRIGKFLYPKLQFTISYGPEQVDDVEDHFFEVNGPDLAFPAFPSKKRDKWITGQALALVSGSTTVYQLQVTRRGRTKNILFIDKAKSTLYLDGEELDQDDWSVGPEQGQVTVPDAAGGAVTADLYYATLFRYAEDSLKTAMPDATKSTGDDVAEPVETVRTVVIIEVIGKEEAVSS